MAPRIDLTSPYQKIVLKRRSNALKTVRQYSSERS